MIENIDEILEKADMFIMQAEAKNAEGDTSTTHNQSQSEYAAAIYKGIRALCEQNKAIIQLLRGKQKDPEYHI